MRKRHLLILGLAFYSWTAGTQTLATTEIISGTVNCQEQNHTFGTQPDGLHFDIADLDGDGVPELVLNSSDAFQLYKGSPDGNGQGWDLVPHFFDSLDVVGNCIGMSIADLNGDSLLDLIVGDCWGGGKLGFVYYYPNQGMPGNPYFAGLPDTLTYTSKTGVVLDSFVHDCSQPVVADLNNDGLLDILVGDGLGDIACVYNYGSPTDPDFYEVAASLGGIDVGSRAAPEVIDLENDQKLLLIGDDINNLLAYTCDFTDTSALEVNLFDNDYIDFGYNSPGGDLIFPRAYDFAEDGIPEVLVSQSRDKFLYLFQNHDEILQPDWQWLSPYVLGLYGGNYHNFVDYDFDGDLDYVAYPPSDRVVLYYENINCPSGAGWQFKPAEFQFAQDEQLYLHKPILADIDQDSSFEIYSAHESSGLLMQLKKVTDTWEVSDSDFLGQPIGKNSLLALADFNQDQAMEIAVLNPDEDEVSFFFPTGNEWVQNQNMTIPVPAGTRDLKFDKNEEGGFDLYLLYTSGFNTIISTWQYAAGEYTLTNPELLSFPDQGLSCFSINDLHPGCGPDIQLGGDSSIPGRYRNLYNLQSAGIQPSIASPIGNIICDTVNQLQLIAQPNDGTWGGSADPAGLIEPMDLGPGEHLIIYTLETDGCLQTDSFWLEIQAPVLVSIDPAPTAFCTDAPSFTFTAEPDGGIWGGQATSSGKIFPSLLDPGTYIVTYELPDAVCANIATFQFEVVEPLAVNIVDPGILCIEDGPYTLSASPGPGTWGGAALANGTLDLETLGVGTFEVTYSLDSTACSEVATLLVSIEECVGTFTPRKADDIRIKIYPNPFSEEVTLEINSNAISVRQVEILNNLGQVIEELYLGESNHLTLKWQGQQQKSGVFLIRITLDQGIILKRLISVP